MKKTLKQLREQRLAANEKLGDLYNKAAGRELTDEEKIQEANLEREIKQCEAAIRGMNQDAESEAIAREHRSEQKKALFRELMSEASKTGQKREILLNPSATNTTANVTASGAIELSIHDVIPTLNEGLGLPSTLKIVTGVTGNELYPYSINDVEMEETGEVDALTDQVLDFTKITVNANRVGLKVSVSNAAIDNAAFDLMTFIQAKITLATKKYLAKKVFSQAAWNKNKGPFSGLAASGDITLGVGAYKSILKAVAKFGNKGFDDGIFIVMDKETEAELKATPKHESGAGGFVIENGLCAGYPYTTTHYINTKLAADGKTLEATSGKSIGFGYFEWLALQQHGEVKLIIDPLTLADKNVTRILFNVFWSTTDLSAYINGGNSGTQAFALYNAVEAAEAGE
jgi:HK97 family phage major capsid protein